jgi:hypothetical protein
MDHRVPGEINDTRRTVRSYKRIARRVRCSICAVACAVSRCSTPGRGEINAPIARALSSCSQDASANKATTRFSSAMTRICSCTSSVLLNAGTDEPMLTGCRGASSLWLPPSFSQRNSACCNRRVASKLRDDGDGMSGLSKKRWGSLRFWQTHKAYISFSRVTLACPTRPAEHTPHTALLRM